MVVSFSLLQAASSRLERPRGRHEVAVVARLAAHNAEFRDLLRVPRVVVSLAADEERMLRVHDLSEVRRSDALAVVVEAQLLSHAHVRDVVEAAVAEAPVPLTSTEFSVREFPKILVHYAKFLKMLVYFAKVPLNIICSHII